MIKREVYTCNTEPFTNNGFGFNILVTLYDTFNIGVHHNVYDRLIEIMMGEVKHVSGLGIYLRNMDNWEYSKDVDYK